MNVLSNGSILLATIVDYRQRIHYYRLTYG